jgi:lipid A ethanolaminephosphotransferase
LAGGRACRKIRRMSLKLFRHTDYAQSILSPGETRFAMHPGWAVLVAGAWVGFVANAWFWRALLGSGTNLPHAVALGLVTGGAAGFVLSLFGWRRTFKPVAACVLLLAGVIAAGAWTQGATLDATLESRRLLDLLPPWASFFGWQVPTLVVLLGLVPVIWLGNLQLRRLDGPSQLRTNLLGMTLAALAAIGGLWLLGVVSF